jgi:dTDP-L-rhamnose 4-epimerase
MEAGHQVCAYDSLVPQVHGHAQRRPDYLPRGAEFILGDVRDRDRLASALHGVDAVIHLASLVGVGQSMYQIAEYTSVNNTGTAELLQVLIDHPVETLLVASSMSIYGEGLYRDKEGQIRAARDRTLEQLRAGDWEVRDEKGSPLIPVPTPESKQPAFASIYALSKYDQERMCLIAGRSYGMRTLALRLWNAYGPFQALSNPYTGVLSNFAARVLSSQRPLIYEDGRQMRDFVSVYDVARAFLLALEHTEADGVALNISSGQAMSVGEVASHVVEALGRPELEPDFTGKWRAGDIRHCFAEISAARDVLGWEPRVSLEKGISDLAQWIEGQQAQDRGMQARAELAARGLLV